ncbi:MAG TPA: MgtC/SapB family protein, partial [Thermomicrobiales bacterium]|nr:MgtC/SapB family protein [Thermomicrobiales bacterium]
MTEYEALLRVGLAAMLGGIIGYDRESHQGSAGLRTHMLVALGAATFTVVAILITDHAGFEDSNVRLDPTRIIQGIITGIGFLGAGVILQGPDIKKVKGLTTAAAIWVTAAIGMLCGLG